MPTNELITTGQLTLYDYNDALIAGTPPKNPEINALWLDTASTPNTMKRWSGTRWESIGELDPAYTEKVETIVGNIGNLEKTLNNMADDGKLDYSDRQEITDKLLPIIGYLPPHNVNALKTSAELDSGAKGSFAQLRQSAINSGLSASHTAYTGLATAWTNLRNYLNGLTPKPWDLSIAKKEDFSPVVKDTFRTHWLNYYNAEYSLATATSAILKSAISTLTNTTIPAMRDSVLSSAEKTAIKQSLIILSSEKAAVDGEVLGLKANPKFENQNALNASKSEYDTSYTGVTSAIDKVLAVPTGTLIPSFLTVAVETAVSNYSEKLSSLKKSMQDAQTAISKKVSDDASKELNNSLKGYVDKITYGQDIETIQNQVDGAITTWFGDKEPTLLNPPAKDWNTPVIKDVHLGDLYYDTVSGYGYRFAKEGAVYSWIRIVDADVVAALAAAQSAQDTADGKRRAFYNQPIPPYDVGDLWVQGKNGELMRAQTTKPVGGVFNASDWVVAVKYTDDTTANAATSAAKKAQEDAVKAQADATKANSAVNDIISDSKITPDEKVILQREWLNIQSEQKEILSQAERYEIDTSTYLSAFNSLNTFLPQFFTNMKTTQDINGETLRSSFQNYYNERQLVLNKVYEEANKKLSDLENRVEAGPYADKTEVLSGTEIFTDKADDAVVHVEIDGQSVGGGNGKNIFALANLFNQTGAGATSNGKVYPTGFSGSLSRVRTELLPVLPSKDYFISGYDKNYSYAYAEFDENKLQLKDSGWVITGSGSYRTLPNTAYAVVVARKTDNSPILPEDVRGNRIQLEIGSAATPYEPPVPTPDYPIAINNLNHVDIVSSVGLNYFKNSNIEKTASREFVNSNDWDMAPIFDEFGVNQDYTISFDLKSKVAGGINIYSQNGSGTKYGFPQKTIQASLEYQRFEHTFKPNLNSGSTETMAMLAFYGIYESGRIPTVKNVKIELGTKATPWCPHVDEISYDTKTPAIYKTNISLNEPLRSVGDVKDRLFRDSDALWKVERNLNEYTFSGNENWYFNQLLSKESKNVFEVSSRFFIEPIQDVNRFKNIKSTHFKHFMSSSPPIHHMRIQDNANNSYTTIAMPSSFGVDVNTFKQFLANENSLNRGVRVIYEMPKVIEILPYSDQIKLNNIQSFRDSNYLYILDEKGIFEPVLHATFKSKTWYENFKRGDDLKHYVENSSIERAIRFGMITNYKDYKTKQNNWLYFCKVQTSLTDYRDELVDEDGTIYDLSTQQELVVPKQALDLTGVSPGTSGYLAFDARNNFIWFIYYKKDFTYTTNQSTGIVEKIPSREYWVKWNPGKTGHNTSIVLDESVYIVGEIEV